MKGFPCPTCGVAMSIRMAQGRKSKKQFIMMVCPANPRHFRGFITDQAFVKQVMERITALAPEVPPADNDEAAPPGLPPGGW